MTKEQPAAIAQIVNADSATPAAARATDLIQNASESASEVARQLNASIEASSLARKLGQITAASDLMKSVNGATEASSMARTLRQITAVSDLMKQLDPVNFKSVEKRAAATYLEAASPKELTYSTISRLLDLQGLTRNGSATDKGSNRLAVKTETPTADAVTALAANTLPALTTAADLGRLVAARRKARKLTQQQFADLAGVGRRFLSELENGKATVEFDKALQVAHAAGISLFARAD